MSNYRIVIDARMFQQSGIGRYIRNLITKLQLIDKDNEYFILHLKDDYDNLKYQNNFQKILANFRWYGLEEQVKLPKLLNSLKADLVHFPHFNIPIFFKGKFVVTIHDLIHRHFSTKRATAHGPIVYKLKQLGYKKVFKEVLKKSEKILVPSRFVSEELINSESVDKNKIIVTHEAVDDKLITLINENKIVEDFPSPYIFYVGNAHPHKNVEGLIKAFLKIKEKNGKLKLILAGHDHYFWQKVKSEFKDGSIIYKGKISDEQLVEYYKNARCFVMPSFEEGFGIPILEAMACSCPVVSSNAGSLQEIGGLATLYFDPANIDDMADKIFQVLNDEKLRQSMIEKGLQRYKEFSWDTLAKKTLGVYLQSV
ncbi:MAG: glycosyltransferase family 4 protein [Actinobacteria bacterium]|nr:glycosyltransferase family 4 protein [Actinomycetota bacterium]